MLHARCRAVLCLLTNNMERWKSIVFFLFISYTLISANKDENELISRAYHVKYKIEKDSVYLTWRHTHSDEPYNGYYISVQQVLNGVKLSRPDFVHIQSGKRSAMIRGLKPDVKYEIKVIAYNDANHKASKPILVNTRGLAMLMPQNLTVSRVTCSSAFFRWKHNPENNVHDIQFKLFCAGVRQYTDSNKELVEEKDDFEHLSYSTSKAMESFFAEGLAANTKYQCTMSSVAGTIESPPSQKITFHTKPGSPTIPPTPVVAISHDSTFTAKLFPTNNRFGPIGHYKVLAVPVSKGPNEPLTAPYTSIYPLSELLSTAVSPQLVKKVSTPTPFLIGSYRSEDLPSNSNFGSEWKTAFKPKTYYSVALAAFTKSGNMSEHLYSLSALSNPPVYISEDLADEWLSQQQPVAKRFTIIVIGTIGGVSLLFTMAFLVLFGIQYYHARKRNAYQFTVSDSDSSDEEIYNKPVSVNKSSATVPLIKDDNGALAQWAVENMNSHNPEFLEVIQDNPAAMKEMSEMMTTIAKKWQSKNKPLNSEHSKTLESKYSRHVELQVPPPTMSQAPEQTVNTIAPLKFPITSVPPPPPVVHHTENTTLPTGTASGTTSSQTSVEYMLQPPEVGSKAEKTEEPQHIYYYYNVPGPSSVDNDPMQSGVDTTVVPEGLVRLPHGVHGIMPSTHGGPMQLPHGGSMHLPLGASSRSLISMHRSKSSLRSKYKHVSDRRRSIPARLLHPSSNNTPELKPSSDPVVIGVLEIPQHSTDSNSDS